jgi:prepilin-type N-terminal cleavage/methylation domain-containing protein
MKLVIQNLENTSNGFTFIEIIATLAILGIISIIATNKFSSNNAKEISDMQILKTSIRVTQTRALGDIVPWSFVVSGTNGTILRNGSTISQVTFATSSIANGSISFDNRGRPVDSSNEPLSSEYSFTITNYAQGTVSVTPITGLVN